MSQFLSVPGVWVYCDPTEEQKSYDSNVPKNVGWIADWVPQPRGPIQRDPAPSRLRGGRRETKKVIAREEGYTYIAALRSPDLRNTTKREGDTSVTSVTNKT